MRHYELVLIIHPDQSSQVSEMMTKYKDLITKDGGKIHREEDWGRKHLAYPIQNIYKAHYMLLNFECSQDTLKQLTHNFRFNDAILRNLVIAKRDAATDESIMLAKTDEKTDKRK